MGTVIASSSVAGMGLVCGLISWRMVRLTERVLARARVYSVKASNQPGSRPRVSSRSRRANRSKRSALRAVGRSAKRMATYRRYMGMRYGPTAGRAVEHERAQRRSDALRRHPGGQAADQGVRHHSGLVDAQLVPEGREPAPEGIDVEPIDRRRLAEAGHVGHDHAVLLGELGQHRRPHGPAALDAAVEQQQRSPRPSSTTAVAVPATSRTVGVGRPASIRSCASCGVMGLMLDEHPLRRIAGSHHRRRHACGELSPRAGAEEARASVACTWRTPAVARIRWYG